MTRTGKLLRVSTALLLAFAMLFGMVPAMSLQTANAAVMTTTVPLVDSGNFGIPATVSLSTGAAMSYYQNTPAAYYPAPFDLYAIVLSAFTDDDDFFPSGAWAAEDAAGLFVFTAGSSIGPDVLAQVGTVEVNPIVAATLNPGTYQSTLQVALDGDGTEGGTPSTDYDVVTASPVTFTFTIADHAKLNLDAVAPLNFSSNDSAAKPFVIENAGAIASDLTVISDLEKVVLGKLPAGRSVGDPTWNTDYTTAAFVNQFVALSYFDVLPALSFPNIPYGAQAMTVAPNAAAALLPASITPHTETLTAYGLTTDGDTTTSPTVFEDFYSFDDILLSYRVYHKVAVTDGAGNPKANLVVPGTAPTSVAINAGAKLAIDIESMVEPVVGEDAVIEEMNFVNDGLTTFDASAFVITALDGSNNKVVYGTPNDSFTISINPAVLASYPGTTVFTALLEIKLLAAQQDLSTVYTIPVSFTLQTDIPDVFDGANTDSVLSAPGDAYNDFGVVGSTAVTQGYILKPPAVGLTNVTLKLKGADPSLFALSTGSMASVTTDATFNVTALAHAPTLTSQTKTAIVEIDADELTAPLEFVVSFDTEYRDFELEYDVNDDGSVWDPIDPEYDFGIIGDTVDAQKPANNVKKFRVVNTGTATLTEADLVAAVKAAFPAGSFTVAFSSASFTLVPGADVEFKVTPVTQTVDAQATISIVADNGIYTDIEKTFNVKSQPETFDFNIYDEADTLFTMPLSEYDFLAILLAGPHTAKNFVIQNEGSGQLTFDPMVFAGSGFVLGTDWASPVVIAPGATAVLPVTPYPSDGLLAPPLAQGDSHSHTFAFTANGVTKNFELKYLVSDVILVVAPATSAIAPYDFGEYTHDFDYTAAAKEFTITNMGSGTAYDVVLSWDFLHELLVGDNYDFSDLTNTTTSVTGPMVDLAPDQVATFTITPKENADPLLVDVDFPGKLDVKHGGLASVDASVYVTGLRLSYGLEVTVGPVVLVDGDVLDLGAVHENVTAADFMQTVARVVLENTGTGDLDNVEAVLSLNGTPTGYIIISVPVINDALQGKKPPYAGGKTALVLSRDEPLTLVAGVYEDAELTISADGITDIVLKLKLTVLEVAMDLSLTDIDLGAGAHTFYDPADHISGDIELTNTGEQELKNLVMMTAPGVAFDAETSNFVVYNVAGGLVNGTTLDVADVLTFNIRPKADLVPSEYEETFYFLDKYTGEESDPITVYFLVNEYLIEADPTTFDFGLIPFGYNDDPYAYYPVQLDLVVRNIGVDLPVSADVEDVTATMVGDDAAAFEVLLDGTNDTAEVYGPSVYFDVNVATGLAVGIYKAQIEITGTNVIDPIYVDVEVEVGEPIIAVYAENGDLDVAAGDTYNLNDLVSAPKFPYMLGWAPEGGYDRNDYEESFNIYELLPDSTYTPYILSVTCDNEAEFDLYWDGSNTLDSNFTVLPDNGSLTVPYGATSKTFTTDVTITGEYMEPYVFTVTFTVYKHLFNGVPQEITFVNSIEGYAPIDPEIVRVYNVGGFDIFGLSVDEIIDGGDYDAFEVAYQLNPYYFSYLPLESDVYKVGPGMRWFSIKPVDGLAPGIYSAEYKISADNANVQYVTVSFRVFENDEVLPDEINHGVIWWESYSSIGYVPGAMTTPPTFNGKITADLVDGGVRLSASANNTARVQWQYFANGTWYNFIQDGAQSLSFLLNGLPEGSSNTVRCVIYSSNGIVAISESLSFIYGTIASDIPTSSPSNGGVSVGAVLPVSARQTGTDVRIRSGASLSASIVKKSKASGTLHTVTAISGNWANVGAGWMSMDYLDFTFSAPVKGVITIGGPLYTSMSEGSNFRAGTSTYNGQEILLLARIGKWWKVQVGSEVYYMPGNAAIVA